MLDKAVAVASPDGSSTAMPVIVPTSSTIRRHPSQVAMDTCSTRSVFNSVVAGYAAGVTGTLVGHPFDSLKVWMQTRDSGVSSSSSSSSLSSSRASSFAMRSSSSTISATSAATAASTATTTGTTAAAVASNARTFSSGVLPHIPPQQHASRYWSAALQRARALYAGVAGPLFTVGLIQSLNFAIYDSSRRMLYGWDHPDTHGSNSLEYLHHDSLTNVCLAGTIAGTVLCFVTSPLLIVKVRQQTTPGLGFRQAMMETIMIAPKHGQGSARMRMIPSLRTMYVGFPLHMLSETVGRIVYFGTYESLKRHLVHRQEQSHSVVGPTATGSIVDVVSKKLPITLQERMLCAAASGILCWSVIFPVDAVRSRLFAQRHDHNLWQKTTSTSTSSTSSKSKSILQMARYMYDHQGGWRAFFRGYSVTLLRAGPVAAAVLPIYDMTLEYMSGLE